MKKGDNVWFMYNDMWKTYGVIATNPTPNSSTYAVEWRYGEHVHVSRIKKDKVFLDL